MKSPIYWSHQDGISKLASYAIQRNLIPFIGAGFSAGSEAAGGCVPDGATACQELIKLILESDLKLSQNDLLGLSFTNLTELFFDTKFRRVLWHRLFPKTDGLSFRAKERRHRIRVVR